MVADIFKYCPDIMKDIREFQELPKMIDPEFDLIRLEQEKKLRNQYIYSADEEGIVKFERLLKIAPLPTASLEERRVAVAAAWNASTPFTERRLLEMLEALCGKGNFTVTLKLNEYYLHVLLQLEAKDYKGSVENLLEKIVPENILLETQLRGNTYGDLKNWGYTHGELKALGLTYGEIAWTVLRR